MASVHVMTTVLPSTKPHVSGVCLAHIRMMHSVTHASTSVSTAPISLTATSVWMAGTTTHSLMPAKCNL